MNDIKLIRMYSDVLLELDKIENINFDNYGYMFEHSSLTVDDIIANENFDGLMTLQAIKNLSESELTSLFENKKLKYTHELHDVFVDNIETIKKHYDIKDIPISIMTSDDIQDLISNNVIDEDYVYLTKKDLKEAFKDLESLIKKDLDKTIMFNLLSYLPYVESFRDQFIDMIKDDNTYFDYEFNEYRDVILGSLADTVLRTTVYDPHVVINMLKKLKFMRIDLINGLGDEFHNLDLDLETKIDYGFISNEDITKENFTDVMINYLNKKDIDVYNYLYLIPLIGEKEAVKTIIVNGLKSDKFNEFITKTKEMKNMEGEKENKS